MIFIYEMSTFLQEDECLLKFGHQHSENAQFCFVCFLNEHLLAIYGLLCPNRKKPKLPVCTELPTLQGHTHCFPVWTGTSTVVVYRTLVIKQTATNIILSFNQNKVLSTSCRNKMFLAAFFTFMSWNMLLAPLTPFGAQRNPAISSRTSQHHWNLLQYRLNISFYRYSASIDTTSSHHLKLAQAPHPHWQVGLVFWLCICSRGSLS